MNTKVINHCLFRLQNILDDLEGKERRVRTPDGIRKFDQPLGSVIRTDKLPDIKKLSFRLRVTEDQLMKALNDLASVITPSCVNK